MPTYTQDISSLYYLELKTWEKSQSVSGNSTVIGWEVAIVKKSGTGYSSSAPNTWAVNIDGWNPGGTFSYNFTAYPRLVLGGSEHGNGAPTITHNSNGEKSISVAAAANMSAPAGSATASGTMNLTDIPRASTATFSPDATLDAGSPVTINTNRASTSFTHTITYSFGSATGTVATGVGASVSWTPPLSLLNNIPNSVSGSGAITTRTYNGSTLLGSKTTAFTLRAPSTVKPTFTGFTISEGNAPVYAAIGDWVQGNSTITWAFSGGIGAYGSTIKSYTVTIGGAALSGVTGTSPVITQSGTVNIVARITDSRGRFYETTTPITVLAYTPPTITYFLAQRCDNTGTPDVDGTYIRIDLTAAASSLVVGGDERNSLTRSTKSKLRGDTTWTTKETTLLSGITYSSAYIITPYAQTSAFDIRVELTDELSTSAAQTLVSVAFVLMHWADDGMGVGKFWEQGVLDVGGDTFIAGDLDVTGEIVQAGFAVLDSSSRTARTRIDSGMVSIVGTGAVTASTPITFEPGLFTGTPRVIIGSAANATGTILAAQALSVTSTGATIRLGAGGTTFSSTYNLPWIAIEIV